MELQGIVKSGFGEAYLWVEKVYNIFKERYNINLFLGTLNIELEHELILNNDEIISKGEYGRRI